MGLIVPIVLSSISRKLNEILNQIGGADISTLGATDAGKCWLLKALHPADALTTVTGVPDMDCSSSVFMNYQTILKITAPKEGEGTWDMAFAGTPNPILFGHASTMSGGVAEEFSFPNPQISGATFADKYKTLVGMAEYWRLAYLGYTVYLEAPALSDQGTLIAYQLDVAGTKYHCSVNTSAFTYAKKAIVQYQTSDQPNYETGMIMPAVFTTPAKNGCYMPIRLSNTHQKWHSNHDSCYYSQAIRTHNEDTQLALPQVASYSAWPFNQTEEDVAAVYATMDAGVCTASGGQPMPAMTNRTWGAICLTGLSLNATVVIVARTGYELKVQPGSVLAPQQHTSPRYDSSAIENYFKISREMKDAYPSEYNDWGKLWPVIKRIARAVSPFISMVPGGSAIAPIVNTVTDVVDAVTNPGEIPEKRKQQKEERKAQRELKIERPVRSRKVWSKPIIRPSLMKGFTKSKRKL